MGGHTLKACPKSCDMTVCKGPCVDKNATACAVWALADECLKNPTMMHAECAATCGVCSIVCEDKHESCAAWAEEGHCETNPEGTPTTCPQSCGVCHDLEIFYHGANG